MLHFFNIPEILTTYGYLGIAIIVFLESGIFFFLPGDSLLFTAGILASTIGLNIYFLIPLIFISTFLGGLAGYEIGIHLIKLQSFALFRKILKQEHLDSAHEFFVKYGKSAVIFSRFVPIIRTFTPIVAGIARMKYSLFVRYSIISSLLWSTIVTLVGYFLGQAFPEVKDYLTWLIILVVFVSILPGILEMIHEKRRTS